MMLSFLMLSTAYGAWPTFEVQCRENNRAKIWDKTLEETQQLYSDNKGSNFITNLIPVSQFTKIYSQVVGGANPLPFDRVECLDQNTYKPCTDMFGETLCEQVALYKQQKTSTCKPMHNLSLTAAAAPQAQDSLTCNMEDAKSTRTMELYTYKWWRNFYPKCPERTKLIDHDTMENAKYDQATDKFTLDGLDVTDQVVCRASTREESVKVAKDALSTLLTTIIGALKTYNFLNNDIMIDEKAIQAIEKMKNELDKLAADDIIQFVDKAMANLNAEMKKLAEKLNELTGGQITNDHMKTAMDIANNLVNDFLR